MARRSIRSSVAACVGNGRGVWSAATVLCASALTSQAQPVFIASGLAEDMSADGTKTVGFLFDYAIPAYVPFVWQRGVGYTQIPGSDFGLDAFRASGDCTAFAAGKLNTSNWGDLNCFNGYCTFGDCTPGNPLPPPVPCSIPSIAHRWTSATGWVNAGSVARVQDPGTGRFFGGTRCDTTVNSVGDFSNNGRYIVGGAWTSTLVNGSGEPSSGVCGDLAAYIADGVTGTVSTLPVQPGTTTSRADSVSADGSVITGYDYGPIIDPEWGPYDGRRICVWTNGVQTLIDDLSGSYSSYPVNSAGTAIVGAPSATYCLATFGVQQQLVVKWNRQPDSTWTPQNLGRPADFDTGTEIVPVTEIYPVAISDDGGTVVGNVLYGDRFWGGFIRPFIWRASINGGVPMDLQSYIAQVAPGSPLVDAGFSMSEAKGLSTDGNAILLSVRDVTNTCPPPNASLDTGTSGVLYLDGAGIPCDAPRIALQPRDYVSTQYTPFGVALNVFASGSWPMSYTWQREDPSNPGQWMNLTEACAGFVYGAEWDYEGITKNQVRIGQATCGNNRDGRYRVIVSNSCGSVISDAATVTFTQGTQILQQPADAAGCVGGFTSVMAVAVSNSADLTSLWEVADTANPTVFSPLFDGPNTLSDGRSVDVFGAQEQFLGMTFGGSADVSTYTVRCTFLSPCGNAVSDTATVTVGGPACVVPCDTIDFNHDDLFPDTADIDDFLSVFSGGPCSNDPNCGDIDFNNDELFPDTLDIDALLSVFSGGPCL